MTDTVKSKLGHPDQYSKSGPKNVRVGCYSWKFGPPDQNIRQTKLSMAAQKLCNCVTTNPLCETYPVFAFLYPSIASRISFGGGGGGFVFLGNNVCIIICQLTSLLTKYRLDTETKGSTQFRNPGALGCSVPSAARALLRPEGF